MKDWLDFGIWFQKQILRKARRKRRKKKNLIPKTLRTIGRLVK